MKRIIRKLNLKSLLFVAVVGLGFTACSDDDREEENTYANLAVRLTDAPGDYEKVWIDVEDVMVKTEAEVGQEEAEWQSLSNVAAKRYDLLQLTGGVSELLADVEIPAGYLDQIRLVLGPDNAVVIDGEEIPMATPSAEQSGLKLQVQQELEAGEDYEYLMDFDVDESIGTTGNSGYILKPVIRLSALENTGSIIGEVHPTHFKTLVKAKNASHEISAYANESGAFVLHGVPQGTYQLTVTPSQESGWEPQVINNVELGDDEVKELDIIYLE